MSKKRLALILPSGRMGGSERVFLNLLQGLNRDLFELHCIIIDPRGTLVDLIPHDIHCHYLGYRRVAWALRKLLVLLRRLGPDVVLSSIGHLNLAILLIKPLLRRKTKVIIRESSVPSVAFSKGKKNGLFRLLFPLLYPRADFIVCPGLAIKHDLEKKLRIISKNVHVIPNPVQVEKIRVSMLERKESLLLGKYKLLAIGALIKEKGFDLLIQTMKKLLKYRPEAHLTIIGDGPMKEKLCHDIESLRLSNHVTLVGFQENPYPFLYQAHVVVSTSRREGLPNVALESLACGTPVAAFNCPGSIGEIIDRAEAGSLIDLGDIDGLALAINRRLDQCIDSEKKSLLPRRFEARIVISQYERLIGI